MLRCYICDYINYYENKRNFVLVKINGLTQTVCSECQDVHLEIMSDYYKEQNEDY